MCKVCEHHSVYNTHYFMFATPTSDTLIKHLIFDVYKSAQFYLIIRKKKNNLNNVAINNRPPVVRKKKIII